MDGCSETWLTRMNSAIQKHLSMIESKTAWLTETVCFPSINATSKHVFIEVIGQPHILGKAMHSIPTS